MASVLQHDNKLDHAIKGHEVVTDTSAHTGIYYGLTTVAATVVSSITYNTHYSDTNALSDITSIPAGVYIPCLFTSITLTSGECILHKL